MPTLRKQIDAFFKDIDEDTKQVVSQVLSLEQEYIHLKNPRGIMQDIENVLDKVAHRSVKAEYPDEN
ncbi:MAG: hypothetical protein AAF846_28815 [Chloroflexota bacterium]